LAVEAAAVIAQRLQLLVVVAVVQGLGVAHQPAVLVRLDRATVVVIVQLLQLFFRMLVLEAVALVQSGNQQIPALEELEQHHQSQARQLIMLVEVEVLEIVLMLLVVLEAVEPVQHLALYWELLEQLILVVVAVLVVILVLLEVAMVVLVL
jgi:hypothetical protein